MMQSRPRTVLLICIAVVILLVLVPAVLAVPSQSAPLAHASGLCQMEYSDRMISGRAVWEVTSITLGPEGGKIGAFQFRPGDVIVKVGTQEVQPGDNLDQMLRTAVLEGRRTITLCDPQTGYEVMYPF